MAGKWSNQRENLTDKGLYTLPIRGRFTQITLGTNPGDPDLLKTYVASKAPDALTMAEEIALANEGRSKEDIDASKMMTVFPVGMFLRYDNPNYPDEPEFYDPQYDVIPAEIKDKCKPVTLPFMSSHQFEGKCKEAIYALRAADKNAKEAAAATEEIPETDPPTPTSDDGAMKKRGRSKKATKATGVRFASAKITSYKKVVDLGFFCVQRRIPILVAPTFFNDLGEEIDTYNTEPGRKGKLPVFTRPLRTEGPVPRVCINASEFVPAGSEFYLTFKLLDPSMRQVLLEVLDYSAKVGMLQWRSSGKGTFIWTPADEKGHPIDEIP